MLKLIKQLYARLICDHTGELKSAFVIGKYKCKKCGKIIIDNVK